MLIILSLFIVNMHVSNGNGFVSVLNLHQNQLFSTIFTNGLVVPVECCWCCLYTGFVYPNAFRGCCHSERQLELTYPRHILWNRKRISMVGWASNSWLLLTYLRKIFFQCPLSVTDLAVARKQEELLHMWHFGVTVSFSINSVNSIQCMLFANTLVFKNVYQRLVNLLQSWVIVSTAFVLGRLPLWHVLYLQFWCLSTHFKCASIFNVFKTTTKPY